MQIAWSRSLPSPPSGVSLAREPGTLFVWDAEGMLARLDPSGQIALRERSPVTPCGATLSDDGRLIAVVSRRGQVCLLTLDLVPIWERALPRRPTALALDPLGRRLAVADEAGGVFVFDREGAEVWRASVARPLTHLAFVPEAPALVGAAEFGLVCAFDAAGDCAWRDGLVAHVGSLSVSGTGEMILLACFTEGLCSYAVNRPRSERLPNSQPARLAAVSYTGDVIVTAGLERQLLRCGPEGGKQDEMLLSANPLALALEAIGGAAVVALVDGTLVRVEMNSDDRGR